MKKNKTKAMTRCRLFATAMVMTVCFFTLFESNGQPSQQGFANYITISNGEFWNGSAPFKPICINYLVDYAKNINTNEYYIAPHFNYSTTGRTHNETEINGNIYYGWHWGYGNNGTNEKENAENKLDHDLAVMDSLGFNVVRIAPVIRWQDNTLIIPTGTYAKYFELTDTLIAKCTRHNLRVILVLEADTNGFRQFDQYCVYLDSVSRHYSSNKSVMAYVVFAEPGYKWKNPQENDKIMISNWSRKWYYLIKKNAPNQLVTYGLDGINNVLFWDPSALTYDFLSMHFYYDFSDINVSKKGARAHFKWMKENVEDVWVLGETGFSGTSVDSCRGTNPVIGSEEDQREYARFTTWLAVGCDCKGYAWWQYQDVNWESCEQNHHGLITTYSDSSNPKEQLKQVANIFPISPLNYEEPYSCSKPNYYYNIPGYSNNNVNGVVLDENSSPIQDAIVEAWASGYQKKYSTFTNSQGEYTVKTPANTSIALVWISQKGYAAKSIQYETPPFTTTLTHLNYNRWKKNWMNIDYPVSGCNPNIKSNDVIIVGNFCDDEAQEMLVIKKNNNTATLYKFHINHWEQIWTGSIGNWQISSTDNFYAGDYNGDGYDELLCVQNVANAWAMIFHYDQLSSGNPWQYVWANIGNGQIGNWSYASGDIILPGHFNDSTYCSLLCIRNSLRPTILLQRMSSNSWETIWQPTLSFVPPSGNQETPTGFDKYYVGDFNGDGYDELFCTQVTNGTTDQMKLLRYSNTCWNSLWSNNGISEGIGIYPYRANLNVGNFDSDRADEILGIGNWATKFDFNTSNDWQWSWSTYESGRLSDWTVNPSHHIFFMKVMTDVPDYLFVSSWTQIPLVPDIHLFNAYSYDP